MMGRQISNKGRLAVVTGLSQSQFEYLLPYFSDTCLDRQKQAYEQGRDAGTRTRRPGGGANGKLPIPQDKLIFILAYCKTHSTFKDLSHQFDIAQSKAHVKVHKLCHRFQEEKGERDDDRKTRRHT